MFFRYHGNFSIKLSHIPSYITTYKNSKTKRAQEKACFLSILQISKHASVARCWLIVDFYLSCHKHTSKLLVALSRVSKSLLDRFLDRKTWFFVFSDFYARCVPKGLIRYRNTYMIFHESCKNFGKINFSTILMIWALSD